LVGFKQTRAAVDTQINDRTSILAAPGRARPCRQRVHGFPGRRRPAGHHDADHYPADNEPGDDESGDDRSPDNGPGYNRPAHDEAR
jgi:hypothetical protein